MRCRKCRRTTYGDFAATGRHKRGQTVQGYSFFVEVRCVCGHVWWSYHITARDVFERDTGRSHLEICEAERECPRRSKRQP